MKTIFFDVDTQNDFMNKDGALYVPDAELIKPNLKKLTDFVRGTFIPIFGSMDKHFGTPEYKEREEELARNGGPFPDHCMVGTTGQEKISETALESHYDKWADLHTGPFFVANDPKPEIYDERCKINVIGFLRDKAKSGMYFEKQSFDVFTNPATELILKKIKANQAVVYGVATDYCVKAAVLGMQKRGIQTLVVKDAIKAVNVNPGDGEKAIEEMEGAGAKFVTVKQVLEEIVK